MISVNKRYDSEISAALEPFFVNECGLSVIETRDYLHVRPKGRNDYHLVYFTQGKGDILTAHGYVTLEAGEWILLPPHQKHGYRIYRKNHAVYYWIHFEGTNTEELLKQLRLPDNTPLKVGVSAELIQLFQDIIRELQTQSNAYLELCSAYLLQMMGLFSRKYYTTHTDRTVETAVRLIHDSLRTNISNEKLAEACGYSKYHFIRLFKKATGVTPAEYRNRLRIENACRLMENTSDSFTEIAEALGFSDSSYFTKIFKKYKGCSPQSYRKQLS